MFLYLVRLSHATILFSSVQKTQITFQHNPVLFLKKKLHHFLTSTERLRASGGSSQSERNKDSNPFTHSSHGNPAFTPQKVSKGSNLVSKSRIEEWLIPNGLKHQFISYPKIAC